MSLGKIRKLKDQFARKNYLHKRFDSLTRYLYEIKTENNKLVNYLLSNYRNLPVVDNLQDVLDLDKIKITNSTYEDITDKNIIETIDEQTSKFNWIKKNLIKEMKATKNDKQ